MKIISIIGIVIALIGLGAGIYCQVEYVPKADQEDVFGLELWIMYMDAKFLYGSIALFAGASGLLLGLIGGIKKEKLGWIAVGIGLISTFLGLAQSTHMFD